MFSSWRRRATAGLSIVVAAAGVVASAMPAEAARRPRTDSLEYRKSWGLEAIGAQAAYRAGLSGRGVTLALIDCGVEAAQREVRRNVKTSRDVVAGRATPAVEKHGAYVAGPLVSALNGGGMVGVAYNANVVSIRADFDGGLAGECAFRPTDLAAALDEAVAQKARIVVMPLQGRKPLGAAFEAALERTVKSGAVLVIAAGNRKGEEPTWPARYAADPRFAGSIVVAGASSYYGELTPWSNRAGAAKWRYVAAPGEWVLTDCTRKCKLVSGTSFSTAYVAGALALMMEGHPELTGPQVAERVLSAARDLGEPGADAVYGRGVLDLGRAFAAAD
ncbi:S8 family peptidase [Phenylobacterium sp.]|uniref:S8 family peptidase n=1 Tax=Phenylobacterium sp. TaxID=1871053 RepID=UPI0035B36BB7